MQGSTGPPKGPNPAPVSLWLTAMVSMISCRACIAHTQVQLVQVGHVVWTTQLRAGSNEHRSHYTAIRLIQPAMSCTNDHSST